MDFLSSSRSRLNNVRKAHNFGFSLFFFVHKKCYSNIGTINFNLVHMYLTVSTFKNHICFHWTATANINIINNKYKPISCLVYIITSHQNRKRMMFMMFFGTFLFLEMAGWIEKKIWRLGNCNNYSILNPNKRN